ncbi:MAG: DNA replication initiation complex subunit [Pyrobaculum sp.]|jgi:DNA replication factor GINS|nr:DNA replication initiation complex subunit [Pyrobaculum sp.]
MIEKLRLWLAAEINSRLLADPPFSSYAEVAEEFIRELEKTPLPQTLLDKVKEQLVSTLLAIIEVRMRKIVWELGQGRVPGRMTAEEDRLVRPLLKIQQAGPQKRRAHDYVLVQFLMPHPAIVTEDFIQVGPFAKGDLAKLPLRDAKDLEERKIVRRFLGE